LTLFTEKVDFIPERVDFLYSQLAGFVRFCEDFRIKNKKHKACVNKIFPQKFFFFEKKLYLCNHK